MSMMFRDKVVVFGQGNTRVIWNTYIASMLAYATALTVVVWGFIIISRHFDKSKNVYWLTIGLFVSERG